VAVSLMAFSRKNKTASVVSGSIDRLRSCCSYMQNAFKCQCEFGLARSSWQRTPKINAPARAAQATDHGFPEKC
jgi:hypothetical protein